MDLSQAKRPNDWTASPLARISEDYVFCSIGIDIIAVPFHIKLGHTCRPTIVKAYTYIFVCLFVKASHIDAVSDLSLEAFIACLKWFIISPLETKFNYEWSWCQSYQCQSYQCHSRDQKARQLPESAEEPKSHPRIWEILSKSSVSLSLKCTLLWWTLGRCCSQHEDSPTPHGPVKLNFEELSNHILS